jgi:hypothetical protein
MKKRMLIPAVAALLFSVGSARADDPPPLREGLWSKHSEATAFLETREPKKEKPSAEITPTTCMRELN